MKEYIYPQGCREISGFGGGYEDACRNMVIAGMKWFDENPSANPKFEQYENITGICTGKNEDAGNLEKALLLCCNDCSGAMFQAAVNHTMFAHKNGWDKYIEEMSKTK